MQDRQSKKKLTWSVRKENIYTIFNFSDGSLFKRNNLRPAALFRNQMDERYFLNENTTWCPVITIKKMNGNGIAVSKPSLHYRSKGEIIVGEEIKYYWEWLDKSTAHHIIMDSSKKKLIEIELKNRKNPELAIKYYDSPHLNGNKDILLALGMFHFSPILVSHKL